MQTDTGRMRRLEEGEVLPDVDVLKRWRDMDLSTAKGLVDALTEADDEVDEVVVEKTPALGPSVLPDDEIPPEVEVPESYLYMSPQQRLALAFNGRDGKARAGARVGHAAKKRAKARKRRKMGRG